MHNGSYQYYWTNLPPCWKGGHGGGGGAGVLRKCFSVELGSPALCTYYDEFSRGKNLKIMKHN